MSELIAQREQTKTKTTNDIHPPPHPHPIPTYPPKGNMEYEYIHTTPDRHEQSTFKSRESLELINTNTCIYIVSWITFQQSSLKKIFKKEEENMHRNKVSHIGAYLIKCRCNCEISFCRIPMKHLPSQRRTESQTDPPSVKYFTRWMTNSSFINVPVQSQYLQKRTHSLGKG